MRSITVKGIGSVVAIPDLIVIMLSLESVDKDYEKTMDIEENKITELNDCISKIGFEKSALKTTNFNIDTRYDSVRDKNGNYNRVFVGYACNHSLKLEFDFDSKKLAEVLQAISNCSAKPELNIKFTVKDTNAVYEELLQSAAINARQKAEVLCKASGVKMCALNSIDYNWGELNVYSRTRYSMDNECLGSPQIMACKSTSIDFEPEDIKLNDSVTFVWEIE